MYIVLLELDCFCVGGVFCCFCWCWDWCCCFELVVEFFGECGCFVGD